MLNPEVQKEIDDYLVGLFNKVIDVFEEAEEDSTAEDVRPAVFRALGIRENA